MLYEEKQQCTYEVRVGHLVVHVLATTRDEAIDGAKRKLSSDLPRLWDVIMSLEPSQFHILSTTPVKQAG